MSRIAYGTTREDGYRFKGYQKRGEKIYEHWMCPASWEAKLARTRKWTANKRATDEAFVIKEREKARVSIAASRRRDIRPHLLAAARFRAKKAGLPFDITVDDIPVPKRCPVLGIPLRVGEGACTDNGPSVDRIVNSKGYVKGNVLVISRLANRIKTDATPEQVLRVALFYQSL